MKTPSILKKALMALTGAALVGFLIAHLAGNLLVYKGMKPFNDYGEMLEHNPLLPLAETALFILFVIHVVLAIKLTIDNNRARPKPNTERTTAGEATLASRSMIFTGLIVLAFIVLHVWQFKLGDKTPEGGLYYLVTSTLRKPVIAAIYIVSMFALGMHIGHGIGSMFQSLGLLSNNRRKVRRAGFVLGWLLALGFAAIPVWALLTKPKLFKEQMAGAPALEAPPASNAQAAPGGPLAVDSADRR